MSAHGLGWNGIQANVTMPTATDGTNSRPVAVPRGAKAVTIFVPALVGVASTLLIQSLTPDDDGATEVWTTITVFDLTDGTFEALDALPESTVVTIPVSALGGGVIRFVASAAQTGAADAITIKLLFNMDG